MIPIKKAKQIREDLNLKGIVIFGYDETLRQHVASHGESKLDGVQTSAFANTIKHELHWPKDKCNSQPLERKCENCDFWQRKKIDNSMPLPENWPGDCMFNPEPIRRLAEDSACNQFEPNN